MVLTGTFGPRTFRTFEPERIEIITGVSGPVEQAAEKFIAGSL
jgi:predicted Fe-Mo cluster-binding NifX family protein